MIEHLDIEWKIAGLLKSPIDSDCIYYKALDHQNYPKRTFGCQDFEISTSNLQPTKLFHQALSAELKNQGESNITTNSLPYVLSSREWGKMNITLRLRMFGERFLVISIHVPNIALDLSALKLIEFQKLSTHPLLESIARFCFNVHSCPTPSQIAVEAWNAKPLMRITEGTKGISNADLVAIVTRHSNINQRVVDEVLNKNKTLNINDEDLLLVDKQGIAFLQRSQDLSNQRNRHQRISLLLEYSLYVKTFKAAFFELKDLPECQLEIKLEARAINTVLNASVLNESVSARLGWDLLKREMGLREISLPRSREIIPFYKEKWFIGLSALAVLAATLIKIITSFSDE